jgi:hypothetical protein
VDLREPVSRCIGVDPRLIGATARENRPSDADGWLASAIASMLLMEPLARSKATSGGKFCRNKSCAALGGTISPGESGQARGVTRLGEARCVAYEHRARPAQTRSKRDHAQHHCGVRHCGFPWNEAPRYLIRDRDQAYGAAVRHRLRAMGEAHLRGILQTYARYYNDLRTHRSLDKDAPLSRPVQRTGSITSHALLGGLHHQYVRV